MIKQIPWRTSYSVIVTYLPYLLLLILSIIITEPSDSIGYQHLPSVVTLPCCGDQGW